MFVHATIHECLQSKWLSVELYDYDAKCSLAFSLNMHRSLWDFK